MKRALMTGFVAILLLAPAGRETVFGTTLHDEDQKKTTAEKQPASPAAKKIGPVSGVSRGRADPFAPLKRGAAVKQSPEETVADQPENRAPAAKPGGVHLEGIIWSSRLPQAVINETLVGIDGVVAGWTVVSIDREKVVLENRGRKITLDMIAHEFGGEDKSETPKEKGHDP